IVDRLANAILKFADTVGLAGVAAIALRPIAGGQVMQHLCQTIRLEAVGKLLLRIWIREEVFDAFEARVLRRLEAVEKVDLVEQHRQIGVEFRHGALSISALAQSRSPTAEGASSRFCASSSNSVMLSISVPMEILVTRSSMISITTGTLYCAIHLSACSMAGSISSCF